MDALAFAAGSGERLTESGTFRFEIRDQSSSGEYAEMCTRVGDTIEGAVDLDAQRAFFEVDPGGEPDLVVTADSLYVRSAVLDGWDVSAPWLSVGINDLENLNWVVIATGVGVDPDFWERAGSFSPAMGLDVMADTVTSVTEEGLEDVRGVETTRFELSIDPASAGLWTGGTTSTTVAGDDDPMSASDDPSERIGDLFNALTQMRATAFVGADGVLRRLDVRVDVGTPPEAGTTTDDQQAFVELRTEFWGIGEPVTDGVPSPDDVTAVRDLAPEAIPAQLSPCYLRLVE